MTRARAAGRTIVTVALRTLVVAACVFGGASCAGHRASSAPVASASVTSAYVTSAPVTRDVPFEPRSFRSGLVSPATRVMVLGISHLDSAPRTFDPVWLAPVLCRLRAYAPDVILTEAMPGEQVVGLDAYAPIHGNAGVYAGPTLAWAREAQAALQLTPARAMRQAIDTSALRSPSPAQRRRLMALWLAAAEPYSAVVQWMQLAPSERVSMDGLTSAMLLHVQRMGEGRSELASIAARLAADLGRARVYGAGDHSSDRVQGDWAAFQRAAAADPALIAQFAHQTPELVPINGETLKLTSPDRVLPVFRVLNSARFGQLDANAQYGSILRHPTLGAAGRRVVAAWEAQNLHMAVAVREATAEVPGGAALLVVGAAHKPFIEAYLRTLSDVDVVSSAAMLDATPPTCSGDQARRPAGR